MHKISTDRRKGFEPHQFATKYGQKAINQNMHKISTYRRKGFAPHQFATKYGQKAINQNTKMAQLIIRINT